MISPVTTAITGREDKIDPSLPEGALAEFYRAFLVGVARNDRVTAKNTT